MLRAGDELVARAVARLMTPEGWKVPVEDAGKRKRARRRMGAGVWPRETSLLVEKRPHRHPFHTK